MNETTVNTQDATFAPWPHSHPLAVTFLYLYIYMCKELKNANSFHFFCPFSFIGASTRLLLSVVVLCMSLVRENGTNSLVATLK